MLKYHTDQNYESRIRAQQAHEYLMLKIANGGESPNNMSLGDWEYVPDVESISASSYTVPDAWADVYQPFLWWSIGEEDPNSYLGIIYTVILN